MLQIEETLWSQAQKPGTPSAPRNMGTKRFPWWSNGEDSMIPVQRAWVQGPETGFHMPQLRVHRPQLKILHATTKTQNRAAK